MSERDQRTTVTNLLKQWDAVAVENPVHPGTPDVNCILGWVELKWLRSWPSRADSIVKVEHFSPQQKVWLTRRWIKGGSVWLLLQCGTEWLLFDGPRAGRYVGKVDRRQLVLNANQYWGRKPTAESLAEAITRP